MSVALRLLNQKSFLESSDIHRACTDFLFYQAENLTKMAPHGKRFPCKAKGKIRLIVAH